MAAKAHTRSAKSTMGSNSDDVIHGTELDDVIKGRPGNDHLFGEGGDDVLKGGPGNDTLEGGSGDDLLVGGPGEDTFVFNFEVESGEGFTLVGTFDAPDSGLTLNGFAQLYLGGWDEEAGEATGFLAPLVEQYRDGLAYTWSSSDSKDPLLDNPDDVSQYTLADGRTIYYEDQIYIPSVDGGTAITTSDGHDTIADFQSGVNTQDTIVLNGLSELTDEQLDDLFDLATVDTDGDGVEDASVLSWGDGMGSITIGGTTEWGTDVMAFFSEDQVFLA
ncbi:hypothetical protein OE699_14290 [Sedimentimonas flavescens]|uniref:Hemolysin type calcium-binding protein n=1 Tax=Sedimentimonas flavescens TaxID=2851012 RepID=A0ABT3A237_9RHOB|nr:hypothetical protein [Sedimentimonas flavescens]MCV2880017.1 hypothetical protein [Sedimentimonas flavescens]